MASFGLTEQQQSDAWRWAICSNQGLILQAGSEPTQIGAKQAAEKVLRQDEAWTTLSNERRPTESDGAAPIG
jgi:hypothetical protein